MADSGRNLDQLFGYVDEQVDPFVAQLEAMVRIPSVSARGEGQREMAELTASLLRGVGFEVELLDTGGPPVIWADGGPRDAPTLLFYDHYDVQPEDPLDQWLSPPFEPTRRDGRLFGRGINDNKGNLSGRICALQAWRATYGELPCRVKFLVEGDEEIGSPSLNAILDRYADRFEADACIWESGGVDWDGAALLSVGMKGMLHVELVARGATSDLHSRDSVRIPNPAWRLVWALSTLKGEDETCRVPGFYDDIQPPNEAERAAARAMPSDEHKFRESVGISGYVRGLSGDELKEWALFQPTCNISGLVSGYTGKGSKTIVPAEARAKLDFRMVPFQDPKAIRASLRRYLDERGFSDIAIEGESEGIRGHRTPVDHPFIQLVDQAARLAYGKPSVLVPTSTGSGPMSVLAGRLNLPTGAAGSSNPESRSHSPNENIRIEDYLLGIKHVATVLSLMGEAKVATWPRARQTQK